MRFQVPILTVLFGLGLLALPARAQDPDAEPASEAAAPEVDEIVESDAAETADDAEAEAATEEESAADNAVEAPVDDESEAVESALSAASSSSLPSSAIASSGPAESSGPGAQDEPAYQNVSQRETGTVKADLFTTLKEKLTMIEVNGETLWVAEGDTVLNEEQLKVFAEMRERQAIEAEKRATAP